LVCHKDTKALILFDFDGGFGQFFDLVILACKRSTGVVGGVEFLNPFLSPSLVSWCAAFYGHFAEYSPFIWHV
jgi:hypothetical protein